MTAGDMARGTPVWVDVNDDAGDVVRVMAEAGVRRVPVMDNHELVGMISEADVAVHLDQAQVKQFAAAIYGAPPNS
jgi:CBS domain-containing protein